MNKKPLLHRIIEEISTNRARIIDDFVKTYIATRLDWFMEKPERLTRLELIERTSDDQLTRTYFLRVKSKLPVKNKK